MSKYDNSEYRVPAQSDRQKIATLEARLAEAERLLKELGVVATSSSVKERYPELLDEVAKFVTNPSRLAGIPERQ